MMKPVAAGTGKQTTSTEFCMVLQAFCRLQRVNDKARSQLRSPCHPRRGCAFMGAQRASEEPARRCALARLGGGGAQQQGAARLRGASAHS